MIPSNLRTVIENDLKITNSSFYPILLSVPILIIALIYTSGLDRNDGWGALKAIFTSSKYIFKKLNTLKQKAFESNNTQRLRLDPELDSREHIETDNKMVQHWKFENLA